MKIWGLPHGDLRAKKIRGSLVIVKRQDGSYYASSWPRKRGQNHGPRQSHIQDNFKLMNAQAPALDPMTKVQMRELATNTIFRPTDLELMLMAGKLWEIWTKDGQVIRPVKIMASEIQVYLDTISTTPGAVIYRSPTGWVALDPGSDGEFLATQPSNGAVAWATPASGGGGPTYVYPPTSAQDSSANLCKGSYCTPLVDITISGWWWHYFERNNTTYTSTVALLEDLTITEILGQASWDGTFQSTAQYKWLPAEGGMSVKAGQTVAILLSKSGTDTGALTLYDDTSPNTTPWPCDDPRWSGALLNEAPVVGSVLTADGLRRFCGLAFEAK